jgi:CIC family chloride channel protein
MVAEMTNGYGLIVPTMLAVMLAFVVQRALTAGSRYPTLYESQVESREDSPVHQGVLVRRAFELVDVGTVSTGGIPLPRLVSMLRMGEPISLGVGGAKMLKLRLDTDSWLVGRTIARVFSDVTGVTAVAVLRRDRVLIPRGPTQLEEGDELVVMASPGALSRLAESVAAHERADAAAEPSEGSEPDR